MTQKPKKGTTPKPKKGAKKKADKRKPGRPSLASQAPPMAQQARSMLRTGGPAPVEITLPDVSAMAMTMCTIPEIASFYDMSERQFSACRHPDAPSKVAVKSALGELDK